MAPVCTLHFSISINKVTLRASPICPFIRDKTSATSQTQDLSFFRISRVYSTYIVRLMQERPSAACRSGAYTSSQPDCSISLKSTDNVRTGQSRRAKMQDLLWTLAAASRVSSSSLITSECVQVPGKFHAGNSHEKSGRRLPLLQDFMSS